VQDMYGRLYGLYGRMCGRLARRCVVREQRPLGAAATGKSGYGELRNGSEAQSDMPCNPSS
jgi:hypothetical protein